MTVEVYKVDEYGERIGQSCEVYICVESIEKVWDDKKKENAIRITTRQWNERKHFVFPKSKYGMEVRL